MNDLLAGHIAKSRTHYVKDCLTIVLAGGRGTRLKDLTNENSKPAVFFGGKFRIIDFVLSNCINSGLRKISVLTQYKSHSLIRHLQRGWSFLRPEANEFIDIMPAQQQLDQAVWYRGTADAVYQNLEFINTYNPKYVAVLAGDHIYKMDYSKMLGHHVNSAAPCTVGCIEIPKEEGYRFGIMNVNESNLVTDFIEKPKNPPTIPGKDKISLGSMGIYIFDTKYLKEKLIEDAKDENSTHDFGHNIIPKIVEEKKAFAHSFNDSCITTNEKSLPYWKDVGTIDTYWEANLELTNVVPSLDIYDKNWPILTYQEQLPPAKFVFNYDGRRGEAFDSVVADGGIISGGSLIKSLAFPNIRVDSYSYIEQSVLLPNVHVGQNAKLIKVVVDQNTEIPADLVVGENPELDSQRFYRTPNGITLITQSMINKL